MTISITNTSRVTITAIAAQTVFEFNNIEIFGDGYLLVWLNGAAVPASSFVVTLTDPANLPSDGYITMAPTTAGDIVIIERRTPNTQETSYSAGTAFPAKSHEAALDKLTLGVQDLTRIFRQTPAFNSNVDANLDYVYTALPDAVTSQIPVFDPTSNTVLWTTALVSGVAPTSFSQLTGTLDLTGVQVDDITPGLTGAVARGMDERVTEWYTVKDFGAVGDDVANDAAAFAACEAAAVMGAVYVPAATYAINTNTTITNLIMASGALLHVATGVTLTINGYILANPSEQIFSFTGTGNTSITSQRPLYLEWFGADNTGVVESQTAFASAVLAMASGGPAWVRLQQGTYNIPVGITITRENFHLEGAGAGDSGSIIAASSTTGNCIHFIVSGGGPYIHDIAFEPSVTRTSGADLAVSTAASISGTVIERCKFSGTDRAISLTDTRYTKIVNCRFVDCSTSGISAGINAGPNATEGWLEIAGCDFSNPTAFTVAGVLLTSGSFINVHHCTFDAVTYGVQIVPATQRHLINVSIDANSFSGVNTAVAMGVVGGYSLVEPSRNISVTNNVCNLNQFFLVTSQDSGTAWLRGVTITGNTILIDGTNDYIDIDAQDTYYIAGNLFDGEGGAAESAIDVAAAATNVFIGENHWSGFADTAAGYAQRITISAATQHQHPHFLYATATVDPASIAAATGLQLSPITVTGAEVPDLAIATMSTLTTENMSIHANVSAADTVIVTLHNNNVSGGAAIDIASGVVVIAVLKPGGIF